MGILKFIQGNRVYLDVNIWIYALEGHTIFKQSLTELFQAIDLGTLEAVSSELSLAEALVKPIQNQDSKLEIIYKQAIQNRANVSIIPINRDILIKAAQLRATTGLKLPDAIHAATAIRSSCSTFLTNDQGFNTKVLMKVVLLSEVVS